MCHKIGQKLSRKFFMYSFASGFVYAFNLDSKWWLLTLLSKIFWKGSIAISCYP